MELVKERKIVSLEQKTHIASFIIAQNFRNAQNLNNVLEIFKSSGKSMLEAFYDFKFKYLGDPDELMNAIIPVLSKQWIIYHLDDYLPLSDRTIFQDSNSLFVLISPYLFIRVTRQYVEPETKCLHERASCWIKRKVVSLIVQNTYSEIISADKLQLEKIADSSQYKRQKRKMLQNNSV